MLRGNPGKRPLNKSEPRPKVAKRTPPAPAHLSKKAKAHWRKTAKNLHELGLLTNLDEDALAMYCAAFSQWSDAMEKVQQHGAVVKSPNGFPVQSPFVSIANKAFQQMQSMLTEFGMTPASRSRIETPKGSGGNEWDEF